MTNIYKLAQLYSDNHWYWKRTFYSLDDLIEFLSRSQSYKIDFSSGKIHYNNPYLDYINMNYNDTCSDGRNVYNNGELCDIEMYYSVRQYMFFYNNSILDVRNFYPLIEKAMRNVKPYQYKKHLPKGTKFRIDPVPGTGHGYGYCFERSARVGRIIREARDSEYNEFHRKKYWNQFDTVWFEGKFRSKSKSWKDNNKCEKQWMKNI